MMEIKLNDINASIVGMSYALDHSMSNDRLELIRRLQQLGHFDLADQIDPRLTEQELNEELNLKGL